MTQSNAEENPRKWDDHTWALGRLEGRVAVVTDEDGVSLAVVRYDDNDVRLEPLMEVLRDAAGTAWVDEELIIDDPRVREALGMPPLR